MPGDNNFVHYSQLGWNTCNAYFAEIQIQDETALGKYLASTGATISTFKDVLIWESLYLVLERRY